MAQSASVAGSQGSSRVTLQSLAVLRAELEQHLQQHPHPDGVVSLGPEERERVVGLLIGLAEDCRQLRELLQEAHPTQHYAAFASLDLVERRARRIGQSVSESSPPEGHPDGPPHSIGAKVAGKLEVQLPFSWEEVGYFRRDDWQDFLSQKHRRECEEMASQVVALQVRECLPHFPEHQLEEVLERMSRRSDEEQAG
jgi:hypothetical protein